MVVKQLLRGKNFVCYVAFSALQVFECTFEKNFLNLFLDQLLGPHHAVPRSFFIVVSFVLPHLLVVAVTPLVQVIQGQPPSFSAAFVFSTPHAACAAHRLLQSHSIRRVTQTLHPHARRRPFPPLCLTPHPPLALRLRLLCIRFPRACARSHGNDVSS